MQDSRAALADITRRMTAAAREVGRQPDAVTLIAVSKTFGPEAIRPVLEAGQRVFGENRVQEAAGKWPELKGVYADIELHLIGPLQTNKAREAVALFDAIHSLDRDKLAAALAKEMEKQDRRPELFVQVNTGEEEQKAGVVPQEVEAFVVRCRKEHGLSIAGLMCIPPLEEPPGPHFALLAKLADKLGLAKLSMGMSADFETAVKLGATHVRVGSAIFGARAPFKGARQG
ncbi:YggS family pyridoxal phosphate-dependent enzyme [Afifella pfennigii]|uniref:YggS family pyridoxal phosphate-dependent enzyme n=1 Tax=Afifella pfennigii TaxID=209897 RepID=UPI00047D4512|nr:YggS family pyridoxal phosphate-dependent enzyme [Afifella pfennigii]